MAMKYCRMRNDSKYFIENEVKFFIENFLYIRNNI